MATEYLFSNNATTTLAQSISAVATVINVASGSGSLFPSPASGQAFAVTLVDAATGLTNEICYCTSRSGDQLTVVRGREGTNAIAWQAGDTCANYITADVMESWLQESDLDGYITQTAGDARYVRGIWNTATDQRILSLARNKNDSGIYVQLDDGTSQRLQLFGDYATNTALSTEVTNRQNADNNLVAKNASQGPGINNLGIVARSGQPYCVDTAGVLRYLVKSPGATSTDIPIQSVGINNQRIYVSYNNDTQAAWLVRSPAEGSVDTRVGSVGIANGIPYFGYGGSNDAANPLYLATVSALNGKENAGVCVPVTTYVDDFATSDSRVINLPYGHRIQAFTAYVDGNGSNSHRITYPQAFSGPSTAVFNCNDTGQSRSVSLSNGTQPDSTGFNIAVSVHGNSTGPDTGGLTLTVIAIGPK